MQISRNIVIGPKIIIRF